MAAKHRFYVVWKGRRIGIFDNWGDASAQVHGFPGARYKSFDTLRDAKAVSGFGKDKHYFNSSAQFELGI